MGSPRFENTVRSLEEGMGDWRSVTESGWDWEAESDFQCSGLNGEERVMPS